MFISLLSPTFWLSTIHELKSIAMVSPSSSQRDFFSQEGLKMFHKSFTPIIDYSWQIKNSKNSLKVYETCQKISKLTLLWLLYFVPFIINLIMIKLNEPFKMFCNNAARAELQEKTSINPSTSINYIALMLGFCFGINYINKDTVNLNKQT